jgi:hypothetical protein
MAVVAVRSKISITQCPMEAVKLLKISRNLKSSILTLCGFDL